MNLIHRLGSERRKRKTPATLATSEHLAHYTVTQETKLHSAKDPAINSLAIYQKLVDGEPVSWILSGGNDGSMTVVDGSSLKTICTAKAHKHPIHQSIFAGETIVSASDDGTIKTWALDDRAKAVKLKVGHTLTQHTGAVTGLAAHPCGGAILSAGKDSMWSLADIESGTVLNCVQDDSFTAGNFSIDGRVLLCVDSPRWFNCCYWYRKRTDSIVGCQVPNQCCDV